MNKSLEKYFTYAYSETVDGLQTLYVVAPGRESDDFKVETSENFLTVSFGETEKVFELTNVVNQQKITAEYKAGILNIALPMKEKYKPRNIKVN